MYVITNEDMIIYPVAFNVYLEQLKGNRLSSLAVEEIRLTRTDMRQIEADIDGCDEQKIIVLDFQRIIVKDDRNSLLFAEKKSKKLAFANLSVETGLFERMATDLKVNESLQDKNARVIYLDEAVLLWTIEKVKSIGISEVLSNVYKKHIAAIINSTMEEDKDGKLQFLESSCIFGNKYANIRKIFREQQKGRFILYCMACSIKNVVGNTKNYKLICTSKTGAIMANILSQMLGVSVIYCVDVGPRFAVRPDDLKECVKENERYIYIFDFLCLGTELKILSTLIADKKSELIAGVGPASFIRCNHEQIISRRLVLGKMKPLINVQDYSEINYWIEVPK